ncbi:hypothetical protein Adeg_1601 [Ammonifex degensii KC4]|uniref:DUF2619 domain-containing protein n=1 Tax=Ammonifex degensii (strain DSM 10501 / KC4) TaxID=429009 RepID=C9R8R7_AMMDK|nr:YqhV family protein [Ammonifex degensii]ACX52696.1 hypothetical protein Adeg_1601 [Ammonifex degensii KC4]
MFQVHDPVVWGMASLRFLSSVLEFTCALLMLYWGRVEATLKVNALMSFVGPSILFLVTFLGIAGLASRISPLNLLCLLAGVGLIFWGLRGLNL